MGRLAEVLVLAALVATLWRGADAAPAPGHLHKSVFVSVGGGAGGGSGGDAGAEGGGVAVVTKPIYKAVPVAYPVPVPVEVPVAVPVEKPVYQKPVYVASKPGGGGQAQGEGAVYGTVNFNAGNLFDNIFNIPISVLRSVNQFLNNNVRGAATVRVGAVKHGYVGYMPPPAAVCCVGGPSDGSSAQSSSSSQSQTSAQSQSSAQSSAESGSSGGSSGSSGSSSSSSSSASSEAAAAGGAVLYKNKGPTFYNDIFNIPVSALTSVNTLLTGGK